MIIEIDENKLKEMEEDIATYITLLSEYDNAVKIKDELIRRYENELVFAKDSISLLLEEIIKDTKDLQVKEQVMDIKKMLK